MAEESTAVKTLEKSIQSWPQMFRDLNQGGDTARWQKEAIGQYAPSLLFGQSHNGVTIGAVVAPESTVTLSFPAFFDEDPLPSSQAGQKIKFNGKTRQGIVVVTDQRFAIAHDLTALNLVWACPLGDVHSLNPLQFKFSLLSMTSSGPGYELMTSNAENAERIVFRVALEPSTRFESLLRGCLKLS